MTRLNPCTATLQDLRCCEADLADNELFLHVKKICVTQRMIYTTFMTLEAAVQFCQQTNLVQHGKE